MSQNIVFDPAVLAAYHAQYGDRPSPAVATVQTVKASPAVKAPKAPKASKAEKTVKASAFVAPPCEPNKDRAVAFLAACSASGRREIVNPRGIKLNVYQGDALRVQDETAAILAFVGYDSAASHGAQLDVARNKARFLVRPVAVASHSRRLPDGTLSAAPAVSGYVAGAVNAVATTMADLVAREKLAAEGFALHDGLAAAWREGAEGFDRATHIGLRDGFAASIVLIREDMAKLGA